MDPRKDTSETTPLLERYFEDYVPGLVFRFGPVSVSEAEIVNFALNFDPQPMHTEPEQAAHGHYQGVIASGWHTGSLMMRLLAQSYVSRTASLGSPGVDEIRWLKPVRPGDSLSIRVTIIETRRSRSKPDRGIVRHLVEVLNQKDELVMSMKNLELIRCRQAL